MQTHF